MSKKTSKYPASGDEEFHQGFDKIFHNEKVDVAHLNPNQSGDVDQERKNYYRYARLTCVMFINLEWSLELRLETLT